MGQRLEYKFVRLGEYAGSALFGVSDKVRNGYEDVVHEPQVCYQTARRLDYFQAP
jgi:hypothetical protein